MKKKSIKKFAGFTLVELLVVMTIIVVLASVGLVSYRSASQGARDAKRKADIETVRQALVMYKQENEDYPGVVGGTLTADRTNFTSVTGSLGAAGFLQQPYPSDTAYTYRLTSSGQGFCVCAALESTSKGNATSRACAWGTGSHYCAVQP